MRVQQLKAAIFDMDGLLIDSEPFWQQAEVQVFSSMGLAFTPEMPTETMGIPINEVVRMRQLQFNWDVSKYPVNDVSDTILNRVIQMVQTEGAPMPGVPDIIERFRQRGYRIGLASSSSSRLIDATLVRLGIPHLFDVVQSAEHLAFGKPHPQVFLECARGLNVSPESCIVFEDSRNGVIAAKAANMMCVAVPEKAVGVPGDFEGADLILSSLAHFDWNQLEAATRANATD